MLTEKLLDLKKNLLEYAALAELMVADGKGNRSIQRKPALAPLCPPQIPLDQTWD